MEYRKKKIDYRQTNQFQAQFQNVYLEDYIK